MSKRVSNNKRNQFGRGAARQRVRYGWRKRQAFAIKFALEAKRRLGLEMEEVEA
jgi:hypothetical protein